MTTSQYLAAAVQFEPTMGDTEGNVSRLLELTADAATRGADLVVLPEMATTGYCWSSREEIAPFVETIPEALKLKRQSLSPSLVEISLISVAEVVELKVCHLVQVLIDAARGQVFEHRLVVIHGEHTLKVVVRVRL